MGIDISETRGHKEVPPILLCKLYCFQEFRNFASAQLQRGKADSLQLKLVTLFTKREVVAALMQQEFCDFAPRIR